MNLQLVLGVLLVGFGAYYMLASTQGESDAPAPDGFRFAQTRLNATHIQIRLQDEPHPGPHHLTIETPQDNLAWTARGLRSTTEVPADPGDPILVRHQGVIVVRLLARA